MEQSKNDIQLGKFISLILRHKPEVINLSLDLNGWANVDELLDGINKSGKSINMEKLEKIVEHNNKKRYIFNDDKTKIRANQGHSIKVDVELKQKIPPQFLYHGTAVKNLVGIKKYGIQKQNRLHVHLSSDVDTAYKVGSRHGKPCILKVNSAQMHNDGYIFYLSNNNVWLCEMVNEKYFEIL